MQIHLTSFEKENSNMTQNPAQITRIAVSEEEAEKKQLVTEN